MTLIHKSKLFLPLLVFLLSCQFNALAQYIIPHSGDTTITISNYSTHSLRNPNWPNNNVGSNSTITFNSYDGRPFSIIGSYVMHNSDHLIFYDGPSTDYPVVGIYYNGRPDVNIYCHSGSITIKHFSSTGGTGSRFNLDICFSSIYDVRVENTTTESTTIRWNDYINHNNYRVDVIEYEGNTRQTYTERTYSQRFLNYYVSGGVKYPYYIRTNNNINDTGTCSSPVHYFRTPRIQDCSHCDHNRNCIDYTALNADMSYVYSYRGTNTNPELELCNENGDFTSETARHAVHTARSRKDSRTGNQLKEVPSGDTASVRLGNWNGNHEGESIMYEIHVDTNDYNLMMLRYAVVFLKADGTEHQQPRFSIRLTDENCIPLEPLCYNRDYFANTTMYGTTGWLWLSTCLPTMARFCTLALQHATALCRALLTPTTHFTAIENKSPVKNNAATILRIHCMPPKDSTTDGSKLTTLTLLCQPLSLFMWSTLAFINAWSPLSIAPIAAAATLSTP